MEQAIAYIHRILNRLLEAEHLGSRRLASGVHLIGHVPHVAPEAYLHVTFPGLSREQIDELEHALPTRMPPALREFYTVINGLELFAYNLSIFGRNMNLPAEDDVWEPFCLIRENTLARPVNSPTDLVFFAFYQCDGSQVAASAAYPEVVRYSSETLRPLNHWDSLETMLESEFDRLSSLFDEQGRKRDEKVPTAPPPTM